MLRDLLPHEEDFGPGLDDFGGPEQGELTVDKFCKGDCELFDREEPTDCESSLSLLLYTVKGAFCESISLPGLRGKIPVLVKPDIKLLGV